MQRPHASLADVRDNVAGRTVVTYFLVGTGMWTATSLVFARYVVEPMLFRTVTRGRFTSTSRRVAGLRWRSRGAASRQSEGERYADVLDAIGRELRLGASIHAAALRAIDRHQLHEWNWLLITCGDGRTLTDLTRNARSEQESFALRSITIAAESGDAVHAVETAARALRTTAAITAESQTAVAHTKASIAVLTWVPLILVLWLLVRHPTARGFLFSPPGFACLSIGGGLQWAGRRWVRRMVNQACRTDSEIPDFIDVVSVHLRSGRPPALAFLAAAETALGEFGDISRRVVDDVHGGSRFVDALTAHRHSFGLRAHALIDGLIDTERDGLPPRQLFERLAADAHAQRRREADARIRALSVRLTMPLVGCILPSYVLLAVVPLLASQFSSVHLDPQI